MKKNRRCGRWETLKEEDPSNLGGRTNVPAVGSAGPALVCLKSTFLHLQLPFRKGFQMMLSFSPRRRSGKRKWKRICTRASSSSLSGKLQGCERSKDLWAQSLSFADQWNAFRCGSLLPGGQAGRFSACGYRPNLQGSAFVPPVPVSGWRWFRLVSIQLQVSHPSPRLRVHKCKSEWWRWILMERKVSAKCASKDAKSRIISWELERDFHLVCCFLGESFHQRRSSISSNNTDAPNTVDSCSLPAICLLTTGCRHISLNGWFMHLDFTHISVVLPRLYKHV